MTQAAREPRLAEEPRMPMLSERAGLDRHEAASLGVDGLEDRPEATGADALEKAVPSDRCRNHRRGALAGTRRQRRSSSLRTEVEKHPAPTSAAARAGASPLRSRARRPSRRGSVVRLRDRRRARHDPDVVALGPRDDRLRGIGGEVRDQVLGLERPGELHSPDRVRFRVPDEAFRLHRLHGPSKPPVRHVNVVAIVPSGFNRYDSSAL